MKRIAKWLAKPSRTMRATSGGTVSRWAVISAMLAPCAAVVFLTLAKWETDTEMKLATFLTGLIAMLCVAPMVWQFGKTSKEV